MFEMGATACGVGDDSVELGGWKLLEIAAGKNF